MCIVPKLYIPLRNDDLDVVDCFRDRHDIGVLAKLNIGMRMLICNRQGLGCNRHLNIP